MTTPASPAEPRARWPLPYAFLAVGLSLLVFAPIVKNYFWSDDFLVLHLFTNWPLDRFLTVNWAGHLVMVRNAFYAIVHTVAGANPLPYYVFILALHVTNVALVFAIINAATRSAPLACLGAAAWGTCPLNEGSLGWIAASGNVFVATTTLGVVYSAQGALAHGATIGLSRSLMWAGSLLVGAQSFGTGLGVAIGAPLVLLWLLSNRLTAPARAVLLAVPIATAAMYGIEHTTEFSGNLGSSVFAKANFLFHLLALGTTTLFRGLGYEPAVDDFLARPVFDEPTSALSLSVYSLTVLIICLWAIAVTWAPNGQLRRLLVAVTVLALCNYGAIALGRAYFVELLRQPIIPWAGQPRYHYSATALLAIGLTVAVAGIWKNRLATWAPVGLCAWLLIFSVLYARSDWTIRHYDGERQRANAILSRIDGAARAAPHGAPVFTYNEPFVDGPHIVGAASLYVLTRDSEREIYFVDKAAVTVYRDFPDSPLARVMLPPLSSGRACNLPYGFQTIGP
jgi:hypothetical protein